MKKNGDILRALIFAAIAYLGAFRSDAQQTSFVYEARLTDAGAPANGKYDFQISVWDSLAGGNSVAAAITAAPQPVTNGIFTVDLNFGPGVFNGAARWLELRVRTNGSASAYIPLTPRQPINPTPYALFAMTPAGPPGPQGIQGAQGPQGLTGPPGTTSAADILTGTLPDARLSSNIARANDLTTVSNGILGRLAATNTALLAKIADLENKLNIVSNSITEASPSGAVAMSSDPIDPGLLAKGYFNFSSLPSSFWQNGPTANAPSERSRHSAVWTGSEMIIWGGSLGGGAVSGSGAKYSPSLNQWAPITSFLAPAPRHSHSSTWTGDSMIVWGGFGEAGAVNSGGRFSIATQAWLPTSLLNCPSPRADHVAIWTGSRLAIWGGRTAADISGTGSLYNPAADSWTELPSNGPGARFGAAAVWTGDRLVIWGGEGATLPLNTGGRLPINVSGVPSAWQAVSISNAPSPRRDHTAIWTGQRMLIWGGEQTGTALATGAAYDPAADVWTPITTLNAPTARAKHIAVWSGREMLIFGGADSSDALASASAYDPAQDKWRSLDGRGTPEARRGAAAVWSGSELIIFGGETNGQPIGSLQRLNPQPTWHLFRKP